MRSTTRDAASRAFLGIARGTLKKTDDNHLMQEASVDLLSNESKAVVERFQQYGFTSVPLPEDKQGSKAAEVIVAFLGGNRGHGVIIAADDRRHRPKGFKEGESAQYDDQGQKVHISRDGITIDAGAKKLPVTVVCGNAKVIVKDGEISARVDKLTIYVRPSRIDLGKKDAPHAVMTVDGPSEKVFAVIAEEDG